jgi:hypothetical protein
MQSAKCTCCNERTIYRNYLIGLRQTRKLLNNTSNVASILNFTADFTNSSTFAKHVIMGNVILDVSNIKQIHIKTEKDILIIELDKKQADIQPIVTNINNIDGLINIVSLLAKMLNIQ